MMFNDCKDGSGPNSLSSRDPTRSAELSEKPQDNAQVPENGETLGPNAREIQPELARQTGDIRLYTYYLSPLGWPSAFGQTIFISSFAVFLKLPTLWIRWWAEAEMKNPNVETEKYIGYYGLICALCLLSFTLFIILMFHYGIPRSSNRLHKRLVGALMSVPYWFLVSTDTGETTNRFSQDMSIFCMQLPLPSRIRY